MKAGGQGATVGSEEAAGHLNTFLFFDLPSFAFYSRRPFNHHRPHTTKTTMSSCGCVPKCDCGAANAKECACCCAKCGAACACEGCGCAAKACCAGGEGCCANGCSCGDGCHCKATCT